MIVVLVMRVGSLCFEHDIMVRDRSEAYIMIDEICSCDMFIHIHIYVTIRNSTP